MEITFMDMAREGLRPIVRALGSGRPGAEDSRFADRGRNFEARGHDGIGTPIDDFDAAVGRLYDFQV